MIFGIEDINDENDYYKYRKYRDINPKITGEFEFNKILSTLINMLVSKYGCVYFRYVIVFR